MDLFRYHEAISDFLTVFNQEVDACFQCIIILIVVIELGEEGRRILKYALTNGCDLVIVNACLHAHFIANIRKLGVRHDSEVAVFHLKAVLERTVESVKIRIRLIKRIRNVL